MFDPDRPRREWGRRALAVVVITAGWASTALGQSLQTRMDAIVRSTDLSGATCAFDVIDLADGLAVAQMNADKPMIPASNMKLITTAAAVVLLKDDFTFTTQLRRAESAAHPDGAVARGDTLIIVGNGDPAFGDPKILSAMDMTVENLLWRWVDAARRAGVTQVDQLLVDDRIFDRQWVHPNWPADQLDQWYCAQVAGLNFNTNVLDIYVIPAAGGETLVRTMPLDAPVVLSNLARAGARNAVWATREIGTNRISVRGEAKHRLVQPIYVTVDDPPMFFARTLAERMKSAGITVESVDRIDDGAPFTESTTTLLAEVRTPLMEVLKRSNKDSQNLFAEALMKRIGHEATGDPGSWSSGTASMRMFLSKLIGPEAAGIVIDDGSGMSRENRISPHLMTSILDRMDELPDVGKIYRGSLAVGGEDGTLRKRFDEPRSHTIVQAKSGYIRGVVALSGYIGDDQRTYAFSIILNDYDKPAYIGKQMIDRLIAAIDEVLAETYETSTTAASP